MKYMMVVDDEKDVEFLFAQRFRKEIKSGKLNIKFSFSADDALEYLRSTDTPDVMLVLSDINMPGKSGIELLQIIKSEFPSLQVFMVSAYNDNEYRTKARESGADDFIAKPVDFNDLRDRVMPVLGEM